MKQEVVLGTCSSAGAACPPWPGSSTLLLMPVEGMPSGATGRLCPRCRGCWWLGSAWWGQGVGCPWLSGCWRGSGHPERRSCSPGCQPSRHWLSDTVTDLLMSAAQTHRSAPSHQEIGRAGEGLCEAQVGRSDTAHHRPCGQLPSWAEVLGCPGVLLARRCPVSSQRSPAAVSSSVFFEPFCRFCGCCSLKSALSFPSQNNGI